MADSEITDAHPSRQSRLAEISKCPYFRILVIGRANAGKTTILEKVCSVARGTISMIYDQNGSNFVFHDSQGFESGGTEELELVWKFIEKRSASIELRDQLHAIWYCIPMDSPRPLLSAELEFFSKGTGKVPLVTIFTKFDGQIIAEYGKLCDSGEDKDKWGEARINANAAFQQIYLPKVLNTKHPPKAYDCPELATVTAEAIDDSSLQELFVSTQMNNLDLCSNTALQ
ncbi:hypothetical protein F5887DRAFT_1063593 [Amanita rubescens]|nr:hypothetical protein F5887DRAFT_1063593 [Amanita rubescens]